MKRLEGNGWSCLGSCGVGETRRVADMAKWLPAGAVAMLLPAIQRSSLFLIVDRSCQAVPLPYCITIDGCGDVVAF